MNSFQRGGHFLAFANTERPNLLVHPRARIRNQHMTFIRVLRRIHDDVKVKIAFARELPAHDHSSIVRRCIGCSEAVNKFLNDLFSKRHAGLFDSAIALTPWVSSAYCVMRPEADALQFNSRTYGSVRD